MPVYCQPTDLQQLSLNAVCKNVSDLTLKAARVTEYADVAMEGTEEHLKLLVAAGEIRNGEIKLPNNAKKEQREEVFKGLKSVKEVLERHKRLSKILREYMSVLPLKFKTDLLNMVLECMHHLVVYDEDAVEQFMEDQWTFVATLKSAASFIIDNVLSFELTKVDLNAPINAFFKVLLRFIKKKQKEKSEEYIRDMDVKKMKVFSELFLNTKKDLGWLHTLSMQNLACGELIWHISSRCPHLWHFDISGKLFNLNRVCNSQDENFKDGLAFIYSLCGLYGNYRICHPEYEGYPRGCLRLKTLYLPTLHVIEPIRDMYADELHRIIYYNAELEDVTGPPVLQSLRRLVGHSDHPRLLKLKKIQQEEKCTLTKEDVKLLKKLRLPRVVDLHVRISEVIEPSILDLFPNAKHLTVTPEGRHSCTFRSLLPYLKNLKSLHLKVTHGLSTSDMCTLASNCPFLESLVLSCVALSHKWVVDQPSNAHMETKQRPLTVRSDPEEDFSMTKELSDKFVLSAYREILLSKALAPYERGSEDVPHFYNLRTLKFIDVKTIQSAALFKCVQGSPLITELTVSIEAETPDLKLEIDDDFILKIVNFGKELQKISFSVEDAEKKSFFQFKNLTLLAVQHIINFCRRIEFIGKMKSWNITPEEINSFNDMLKQKNFTLRLS